MSQLNNEQMLIHQLACPAFLVRDGMVCSTNTAAEQRAINIGDTLLDMLTDGAEEYAQLKEGHLYTSICVNQVSYPCCITVLNDCHLVQVNPEAVSPELQALSLAAKQLRSPLSDLSLILDRSPEISDEKKGLINQTFFKIYRMIGNMSDTAGMIAGHISTEYSNLTEIIAEALEKVYTLLNSPNRLQYNLPNAPVYCDINADLIRRAIYNLLSNALKFSPEDSCVKVSVHTNGNKLYITVQNACDSKQITMQSLTFDRFSRAPGLDDPKHGIGLGMSIVHAAAVAHNGTVLVEQTPNSGTKITMTVRIQASCSPSVRSPILYPDLYGGKDQALIELSDVLPSQHYQE